MGTEINSREGTGYGQRKRNGCTYSKEAWKRIWSGLKLKVMIFFLLTYVYDKTSYDIIFQEHSCLVFASGSSGLCFIDAFVPPLFCYSFILWSNRWRRKDSRHSFLFLSWFFLAIFNVMDVKYCYIAIGNWKLELSLRKLILWDAHNFRKLSTN